MRAASKSFRLHIGIFGRRNVGKSSLLNALTRQESAIVSEVAGTTTDPVEKPMEMLPIGPVLFIDTAGVDEVGDLGAMRVQKTRQVFDRTDVALIVVGEPANGSSNGSTQKLGKFEHTIIEELRKREIPYVVVFNKTDLSPPDPGDLGALRYQKGPVVQTVASAGSGLLELRAAMIRVAPDEFVRTPPVVSDLVPPGELALLVVPIDMEAPKGRLIQPQVHTIRDLLDGDAYCMVVKERELRDALERLKRPPALVVTDSQAFLKVAGDTPPGVKMTSFSILFARQKGDLSEFVRGAVAIEQLSPGDRVLIAESCSHHPIGDDIGRVKIPRWLRQYVGGELDISFTQGHDFPEHLENYKLLVHCGACMWNRREVLSRILRCREANLPICNYGMTIAYTLGIFDRALEPFPDALLTYRTLSGAVV